MSEASHILRAPMAGIADRMLRHWDRAVVPLIFLVMVLCFFAADSNYLSATNIVNVLNQVSILSVVAVGASLVIFAGGFDLSAGAIVALSGVAGALTVEQTGSVPLAVLAGIGAGLAVGLLNGFVVGYLNVSPLIVTLGSLNMARGLALIASGGSAIYSFPSSYTNFGTSRFLGLPTLAVIACLIFLAMALVIRFTPFGLYLYAVGGNPRAAKISGIDVPAMRMIAFGISGATCGLAGMMLAARTGGGEPGAGVLYELEAIAAVILGGAALHGGEGLLWRSMMGVFLLGALGNGLNIVGIHPHWKGVAIGAILVIAASLDAIKRRSK
jgi:ribose/xylose/arabinose/galactoside ABC-type transport system permease subunit